MGGRPLVPADGRPWTGFVTEPPQEAACQMLQTHTIQEGRWSRGGTWEGWTARSCKVEDLGTVEQGAKVEQEARA